ncbi:MAG: hypothetical protein V3V05_12835 [Pontiella sp.]
MKIHTTEKYNSKEGGALLMVLLTLLFVSVLQIGLLRLQETTAVESVYVEDHKQAFWMAESGLIDGELLIQYDKSFRDSPSAIPQIDVGEVDGKYNITVTKTLLDVTLDTYEYQITSLGTVNGMTRKLQKILKSYPGGKYAIIGISGTTDLAANVTVDGPIAQITGDVNVHDSRLLDDYLIMGDGESALNDRRGEATVANLPPPPAPYIDDSKYTDLLNHASMPATSSNYPAYGNVVMSGTYFYNNSNTLLFDGKTIIADNTTIVAKGDVLFNKSGVKVGENVTIVTGSDIDFKVQATIEAGTEIYAYDTIHFQSGSGLETSDESVLLMAKTGDIIMDSNFDFRGIMIAELGQVELNSNGEIAGTIIGGVGVDANANITITYDESVFTEGTPIIPKSLGDVILVASSWQELPFP